MNVVQILKDARALIADEKSWTQFALARDEEDICVEVEDPRAVCFCSDGALRRAMRSGQESSVYFTDGYFEAMQILADVVPHLNIVALNDSGTHAEVIAAFDRAIARAESEAA